MAWNFQCRGSLNFQTPTSFPTICDLGQMMEIHSGTGPYIIRASRLNRKTLSAVMFFYVEICHFLENYPYTNASNRMENILRNCRQMIKMLFRIKQVFLKNIFSRRVPTNVFCENCLVQGFEKYVEHLTTTQALFYIFKKSNCGSPREI